MRTSWRSSGRQPWCPAAELADEAVHPGLCGEPARKARRADVFPALRRDKGKPAWGPVAVRLGRSIMAARRSPVIRAR